MRKFFLFLILFWFFSINVSAQSFSRYKYEFYYGIGGTNLMGDVCAPSDANKLVWVNLFNTIGFVGNSGLKYRLSERQSASVNLSLGKLHAEDPKDSENYQNNNDRISNTFFTEVSIRYEMMIVKEQKKKTVYRMLGESYFKNINIPIYLFIGAGGLYNMGKFSQNSVNNSIVITPYSNFTFVIPYGIGFKTRVTNTSYVNLEFGLRFAFSDNIDYANAEKQWTGAGYPKSWYDQYQFITVNYIIKLKANKNGMPVIRTLFF